MTVRSTRLLVTVLALAATVCLPAGAGVKAAAAPDAAPSRTEQGQHSRDRLEIRPDGTVLRDGKPVTGEEAEQAERLRVEDTYAQDFFFSASWDPNFLYWNNWHLFVVHLPVGLVTVPAAEGAVTGLATARSVGLLAIASASAKGSSVQLAWVDQIGAIRRVAGADAGSDRWYRDPMSLSPDKRWLLVMKAEGRAAALAASREGEVVRLVPSRGDICLVDCTGESDEAVLLSDAELLSCAWSADGELATCTVQIAGEPSPTVVVLDTRLESAKRLTRGGAPPAGQESGKAAAQFTPSVSDSLAAHAITREGAEGIEISDANGRTRLSPAPAGVERILGWSAGEQLLAYVGRDGSLYLCTGVVTDAEYEALMSCGISGAGDSPGELRESFGLETRKSPLKVRLGEHPMSAWGSTAEGPFLAYVEIEPEAQTAKVLKLERMSLADLGIDPRADIQAQIAEQALMTQLVALRYVLPKYAADHDGKLPQDASGPKLEADLAPYLSPPTRLRRASSPEEVAVELMQPGAALKDIREEAQRSPGRPIELARVVEKDIGTCTLVLVFRGRPGGPPMFSYDAILERSGSRGRVSYNEDIVGIPSEAAEPVR